MTVKLEANSRVRISCTVNGKQHTGYAEPRTLLCAATPCRTPWRAGKSLRWASQQLGHSSPELTLRTYAHVMPDEETDVSFANFGLGDGSKRLYPAPGDGPPTQNKNTPGGSRRGRSEKLERETRLELATLSLGS